MRQLNLPLTIASSVVPPFGFALCFWLWRTSRRKAQEALLAAIIGIPIGFVMGRIVIPGLVGLF